MNWWVHTPGMPHLVICATSKFEKKGSSNQRIGSRYGFCGALPLYVYSSGCASCRSWTMGAFERMYQSNSARIVISDTLKSRLLS